MAALKPTIKAFKLPPQTHLSRPLILSIRHVHTSTPRSSVAQAPTATDLLAPAQTPAPAKAPAGLSVLPTKDILRSYLITRTTSSPLLLAACFVLIKRMLDPRASLLSPERNPVLRWLFKHTFYAQFCAGENKAEVQRTVQAMKDTGYAGVILELALEVAKGEAGGLSAAQELARWRRGILDTVDMSAPGDFVALKWSGLGREALERLDECRPPTREMHEAIVEVCELAAKKGAALLPSAELEITNAGSDLWTLDLQRKYNKTPKPLMYTTYQVYLRSTPKRLARDLAVAQKEGFTLGVKLVRGAYLLSEPEGACYNTKEDTCHAYDSLTEAMLRRQYNDFLKPADGASTKFPNVAVVIATHNAVSVEKARAIRSEQAAAGQPRIECAFAQLQGMADEISCSLVAASQQKAEEAEALKASGAAKTEVDVPRPFKCAVWGTVGQCLQFLYRRALENKDAASRTVDTRKAMGQELVRRAKATVGWN